uniref:hypothetical protein n=1 Tax=Candidatus Electrothrix sp. TaxID=2170559 RepID=UPI0040572518
MITYIFVLLSLVLLIGVTVFFFRSLKYKEVPANVRLIINAWNSVRDDRTKADINECSRADTGNQD